MFSISAHQSLCILCLHFSVLELSQYNNIILYIEYSVNLFLLLGHHQICKNVNFFFFIEITYNHEVSMFLNNSNNINIQNLNANDDFQMPFFKEEFEKIDKISSLVKFLSNEIQKSKSHKNKLKSVYIFYDKSQNKNRISNVGINWQMTKILFENGSLNSQQFFEQINNFPEFYIEIKFFNFNNFKKISQQIYDIEKLVQSKLKICLTIKKHKIIVNIDKDKLSEQHINSLYYWTYDLQSKINCIKFDSSITDIHGIKINDFYYSFNSLTQVLIPFSVTSIGYRAFKDCQFLTQISMHFIIANH